MQETGRRFVEGHPEIYVVSNVMENGVPIGSLGAGEATWHTDMSYLEDPPKASMLYALEVPPAGGNTYFSSMYRAYESLARSGEAAASKACNSSMTAPTTAAAMCARASPRWTTRSPLPARIIRWFARIRKPGAALLYLGRRRNAYIEGLSLAESESLLDELWSYATREEIAWHNEWRVGDLVLWDNRCTMHRRDPFDASSRRVMHRTQIKGETRPSA